MKKTIKLLIIISVALLAVIIIGYLFFSYFKTKNNSSFSYKNNQHASSTNPGYYTKVIYDARTKTTSTIELSTASSTGKLLTDNEKANYGLYHLAKYELIGEKDGRPVLKFIGVEDPKEIKFEAMDDKTKIKKGIATSTKAQVLRRNSEGDVIEYRVINNDNDILTEY